MYLEIISPEATLFQGEVNSVSLPGTKGSFQLLENHAPIVSTLQAGTVVIKGSIDIAEEAQSFFASITKSELHFELQSGTVEMKENKVILLSD
ncbi:MAG: F0F1 ATP synthase subunit epsilon [Flavobacteriales bacterium]|jgi:F-type H+-transporting ATPase subunit epsilon|nr:F0F1 ATP synthase subunit epsilon [Flavobacteriales bacterium]MBT7655526.1 F0F1 ATP synthase subunit epsilon [Flavobacteriales bacterium]MDG1272773.1 F0F1 ATP synthase subunit epsilon [Flavobacteriaceae bacterium]